MQTNTLATPIDVERAVFVDACQDGWNPQTVVRQLVWRGDAIHEELTVFPSLREALAYTQQAFLTQNGPEPSPPLALMVPSELELLSGFRTVSR